jgi:hypothetical protein
MPRSRISSHKRAPVRRCAICDRVGHNARTCIQGKVTNPSPILHIENTEANKKKGKKMVHIPVVQGVPPMSQHVVSLKNEEMEKKWKSIGVYQPGKKSSSTSSRTLDFATLVRSANTRAKAPEESENSAQIKKPTVDIMREIAHIEGERDIPITIVPRKHVTTTPVFTVAPVEQVVDTVTPRVPFRVRLALLRERVGQSFHIKKFATSVAVLGLLAALPFPAIGWYRSVEENTGKIIHESTNAFLSLQSSTVAAINQNLPQAEFDLNQALNSFGAAQTMVDKEYKALRVVLDLLPVMGEKIKSRQGILEAGHHLALGNAYLIKGVDAVMEAGDATTVERLKVLRTHIRGALPQYEEAVARLELVEPESLPPEHQASFLEFRKLFNTLVSDIQNVADVIGGLELMLGSDGFKRYLVVFQNQYELRPTGGFIGSFAMLDVQSGKILNIDVPGGGSYDLEGQLSVQVKPPVPLQLINERWEFQDANWFPDFRASGKKLAWFYEKSRHTTVDGVIAINASVLERLLRVVGPIENEQYELLLNGENAIKNLMYEIDSYDNADGKNTPKAVLSVLLEQITAVMQEIKPEQLVALVTELSDALNGREVQTYFVDERVQSTMRSYGWTGEILNTGKNQDYLMVVNSNIGGGKSDVNIAQKIQHQSVIEVDGSIVDTVIITRAHEGIDEEDSLFGQVNSSYVRVYVPEGAELIDAGGFLYPDESSFRVSPSWYTNDKDLFELEREQSVHNGSGTRVTSEFGKTSFGNWMVTYPGEQTRIYFTYRLPFKAFEPKSESQSTVEKYTEFLHEVTSRYSMVIQKQSGITSEYEHTVIYPDDWRPLWRANDDLAVSLNGASIYGILEHDVMYGILMKQE